MSSSQHSSNFQHVCREQPIRPLLQTKTLNVLHQYFLLLLLLLSFFLSFRNIFQTLKCCLSWTDCEPIHLPWQLVFLPNKTQCGWLDVKYQVTDRRHSPSHPHLYSPPCLQPPEVSVPASNSPGTAWQQQKYHCINFIIRHLRQHLSLDSLAWIQQQQHQLHHQTHSPASLPGQLGVNTAAAASMHQLHHQTPSPPPWHGGQPTDSRGGQTWLEQPTQNDVSETMEFTSERRNEAVRQISLEYL